MNSTGVTVAHGSRALEAAIASRLEVLSPGEFQLLAEQYAKLRYPRRFINLSPVGRNFLNVSIAPWPDARSVLVDGRHDVVEASKSKDWKGHLEDDLDHIAALGNGRLAGYLFVSLADEPRDTTSIQDIYARLQRLGIPLDQVQVVFRRQLIAELTQPAFCRIVQEALKLRCDCTPFSLVHRAKIFGRGDSVVPDIKEYLERKVHRCRQVDEVESRLLTAGYAVVRGVGASGKTVLAAQVALGRFFAHAPAYYLDLTIEQDVGRVLETMTLRSDEQVLFIVDNIHLDEDVADTIFDHWRDYCSTSHLLMLGRLTAVSEVTAASSSSGIPESDVIEVITGIDDLLGVYRRLFWKTTGAENQTTPPETALLKWQSLFGGDLIAFSFAVMRRVGDLARCQWELRGEDAREYVREKYLYSRDMSEAERDNLLRVSFLSVYETPTPLEALNPHGLRESLRRGVVLRSEHGRSRWVRFRLVHPGLGQLLLDASDTTAEPTKALIEIVRLAPHCAAYLSRKLDEIGNKLISREILAYFAHSAERLSVFLMAGSLMMLKWNVERMRDYGFYNREEIDGQLGEKETREQLIKEVLFSPLNFLVAFLDYAEGKLPGAYESAKQALCAQESRDTIQNSALQAPLGFLVGFLEYAERKLPGAYESAKLAVSAKANREALQKNVLNAPLDFLVDFLDYAERKLPTAYESAEIAVCAKENRERLQKNVLNAPLNLLVKFLDYAERKLPAAYESAREAVCAKENREMLQKRALKASLGFLVVFLDYAERKLPVAYEIAKEAVCAKENREMLQKKALKAPLDLLVNFLDYAERKLPTAYKSAKEAVCAKENRDNLISRTTLSPFDALASFLAWANKTAPEVATDLERALEHSGAIPLMATGACSCALEALTAFLRESRLGPCVLAEIDQAMWDAARSCVGASQPHYFRAFVAQMERFGRTELAVTPARVLIEAAEPRHWQSENITLLHLSQVLRLGRDARTDRIMLFVKRVITDDWLERNYSEGSCGALAASLFGVWSNLEDEAAEWLVRPRLTLRAKVEFQHMSRLAVQDLGGAFQLLGCCPLLKIPVEKVAWDWPPEENVISVLRRQGLLERRAEISSVSIQLWLGLREMAARRKQAVRVPRTEAEHVLSLLGNTAPRSEKQARLNALMTAWLEDCRRARWVLVPN